MNGPTGLVLSESGPSRPLSPDIAARLSIEVDTELMSTPGTLEREVVRKLSLRIVPVLFLGAFVGFLDRVNVAFAALTMNDSLGLTPRVFGWAAGFFFIGYLLFEIPGTVCLARFGSRRSMAAFMIAWGALSISMAFLSTPTSLIIVRFLTGAAEAGFFPGTILYMSLWVPATHRARIGGYFMLAIPLASVIGAPVSALILRHTHEVAGLEGWQWLFILEGLPAVAVSIAVLRLIDDTPSRAAWLTGPQRDWLMQTLAAEAQPSAAPVRPPTGLLGLLNRKMALLCFVQFACPAVAYGVTLWLPQVVRSFGTSIVETGLISALPFITGALAMWWWPAHSDRTGERKWHLTLAPLVSSLGLGLSVATSSPLLKLCCLLVASLGMFSFLPIAWAVSHSLFGRSAAPVGYAVVSMSGALAGFVSPYVMGVLRERTGNFELGILVLAGTGLAAAWAANRLFARQPFESASSSATIEG
jgi:ACS family tartrate transporter-like MFS transporter